MNMESTTRQDRDGDRAAQEAERWFARLRAGTGVAERAAFERWREHPAHARAYAEVERLWSELGKLSAEEELRRWSAQALAADARKRPRPARRSGWRAGIALAATMLVAIGVGIGLGSTRGPRSGPEPAGEWFESEGGQLRSVVLADGSKLTLNAGSAVEVRLGARERHLRLSRGEALFEVAHDARRPFVVEAGARAVRALGTRFQVRRESEAVTVTLLQGSVAVEHEGDEALRLAPGDQLVYDERSIRNRRHVDPDIASSWTRGRLIFRSTPLAEALAEMNRYANPPLRLGDARLASTPISGTLRVGDSASMALALSALLPLQAQPQGDGTILLTPKVGG